jgi:hypothetical protein
MNLPILLDRLGLQEQDVLNVYPYGSRVYGTFRKNSDYDFVVITAKEQPKEFSDNLVNVFFFTPKQFQQRLQDHEISALECIFLPEGMKWKEKMAFDFKLHMPQLRQSLLTKAKDAFRLSEKSVDSQSGMPTLSGRKSLFHALRIIQFGIQIAGEGCITDYAVENQHFEKIMTSYFDWPTQLEEYKQYFNQLCLLLSQESLEA